MSTVADMRREIDSFRNDLLELNREFQELERISFRTLALLRRFSGDENIDRVISRVMRLITIMRQLQMSVRLFMSATGPLGVIMGLTGMVMVGANVAEMFYDNVGI